MRKSTASVVDVALVVVGWRCDMVNKQGPRTNRVREEEGEKAGFEFNVVLYIVEVLECV